MTLNEDEKALFNRNIGHLEEYYDPKNGPGMNGTYPNITTSNTATQQANKWRNHNSNIVAYIHPTLVLQMLYRLFLKKIKVPLPFWFSSIVVWLYLS